MSVSNRRMQCEVRSMLNQGRVWGVYKHTRPKRCPQIWQEITRKPTAQAVLATEKSSIRPVDAVRGKVAAKSRRKRGSV